MSVCDQPKEYELEWQASGVTVHRGMPPEGEPLITGPFADVVSLVLDCLHAEGFTLVTTDRRTENLPLPEDGESSPEPSPLVTEDVPF